MPSEMIKALRKEMIDDIERKAEAVVPGYGSARKAVIDLRGERFEKLAFTSGEELVSVEAYIGWVGLAIVVRCLDGITRNAVVGCEHMNTEELLELHTVVTGARHTVRAVNPFWFACKDWHDILDRTLMQTDEEYREFISNNPKNKKE